MRDEHGELHAETDEARAGSTPSIVRWILLISLFAAIALLSIIWITGAASQDEEEGTVSVEVRDRDDGSSTDSIVGENADRIDTADPAGDTGIPTVENQAADDSTAEPAAASAGSRP